jgi:proteasome lid subunit RPN8/RPN11
MKMKLDDLFGRFLGTSKLAFSEVQIDKEVIEEIIQIARKSHPSEFVALLQGKVENHILRIEGLIFLPGETSNEGGVMKIFMMPLITDSVGSVHSHPGYNANPSKADLRFFAKNGFFHLIIAQPYNEDTIQSYDVSGNLVDYGIV